MALQTFPILPDFANAGTLQAVRGDEWAYDGDAIPSHWLPDCYQVTLPLTKAVVTVSIQRLGRVQYQSAKGWRERIRITQKGDWDPDGKAFMGWGFFTP